MDTLSPELYKKIRNILLRCQEFQSDENLRSIFIVGKLSIYHKKIPEAQSIDTRVDQCIAFLSQEDWEDDSALASFLEALRNRYPEERHYRDLDDVAREVRKVANSSLNERLTIPSGMRHWRVSHLLGMCHFDVILSLLGARMCSISYIKRLDQP